MGKGHLKVELNSYTMVNGAPFATITQTSMSAMLCAVSWGILEQIGSQPMQHLGKGRGTFCWLRNASETRPHSFIASTLVGESMKDTATIHMTQA